jgi:hypothetical protein
MTRWRMPAPDARHGGIGDLCQISRAALPVAEGDGSADDARGRAHEQTHDGQAGDGLAGPGFAHDGQVSPLRMEKETPSTARMTASGVRNAS